MDRTDDKAESKAIPKTDCKAIHKTNCKAIYKTDCKAIHKTDCLKKEILTQYKSIRQFAIEMDIPYSTLVTALDRGIEGMAYGTVIRICDKLHLNPVDFTSLDEIGNTVNRKLLEDRVMKRFLRLNKSGRERVLETMTDMAQLEKYAE